uniref:Serpentine receptor class gamma n=1 Tax=Parastrongyloides trichosuri TaxID=131310 RepID=A0A0N4ZKJ8_PARTI
MNLVKYLDYFQLIYLIILFPVYLYFTINLGFQIYYKKSKIFRNNYFPILFYKGIIDLTTFFVQFFLSRIQKYNVFNSFFLESTYLASVLYFFTGGCYFIMFQISFLTAINRYVAIKKPMKYKEYFKLSLLHFYFFIMTISGIAIGVLSLLFKSTYIKLIEMDRIVAIFLNENNIYFYCAIAICYNLPMLCITTIINCLCLYENRNFFKNNSNNANIKNVESKLFIYSFALLISMISFEIYYIFKFIPVLCKCFSILESIAIQSLSWIIDLMTFGLFIFSLTLSSDLRTLLPFMNKKKGEPFLVAKYMKNNSNNNRSKPNQNASIIQ